MKQIDPDVVIPQPEHVKAHVFLTLFNSQIRYYLMQLLGIDEPIIVYNNRYNIDYSYIDRQVFNPYNIIKTSYNKNESILYTLYPDCFDNLVLWVVRGEDSSDSSYGQMGVTWNLDQEQLLFDSVKKINPEFTINSFVTNQFRTEISENKLHLIARSLQEYANELPDNRIGVNFFVVDKENVFITGNVLNNQKAPSTILVFEHGVVGIIITETIIFIKNKALFQEVYEIMQNYEYRRVTSEVIFRVSLASPINSALPLGSDVSFLFEKTSTNNIILTPDKKTNIIIAKNLLTIKMKNFYKSLEKYFTMMIIAYNNIHSPNFRSNPFLGLKPYYWTRICQNTHDKNRKPTIMGEISEEDQKSLVQLGPGFFQNPESNFYIDEFTNVYKCGPENGDYKYLGFLKIFASINGKCIPCCFIQNQTNTPIYKKCIEKKEIEKPGYDLYVLQYGKYILPKKIGFLKARLDSLMNKDSQIVIEEETRRIKQTDEYSMIVSGQDADGNHVTINKDEEIQMYINQNKIVLLYNDFILYPESFNILPYSDFDYKILIKGLLHNLREIRKTEKSDNVEVYISDKKRQLLADTNPYKLTQEPIVSADGMVLKLDGFYIDGIKFDQKINSKYPIRVTNINFEEKNTNIKTVKKFFRNYFDCIETTQKDVFMATFLTNIFQLFKIPNSVDYIPETKALLEKYFHNFK